MKILKLRKKHLNQFIKGLSKFGAIIGPIKRGESSYIFSEIKNPEEIEIGYNRTILPPKKYFLSPSQTMLEFSQEFGYREPKEEKEERKILFGLHACDIHAIKILDLVFSGKYKDNYYFKRRKNTAIIGISCVPDDLCFCLSMRTDYVEDGFDLFLSELSDSYLVGAGTSLGDDMVAESESLFEDMDKNGREEYKRRSNERRKLFKIDFELRDLPEIMDMEYESKVWKELGEKCLSCGSCSMVCPTCYCFDVIDEVNLDGQSGQRRRIWDSCLFKDYALVAGGLNFRADRDSRIKNRYLHKQRGFVQQYGKPSCVGCGRCIKACPAKIDIVEVITKMREETYG